MNAPATQFQPQTARERDSARRPIARVLPTRSRRVFTARTSALGVLALCAFAISPEIAVGQRGGGSGSGHAGGGHFSGVGGGYSSSGTSHAQSAAAVKSSSSASATRSTSANSPSLGHAGNGTISSPVTEPPTSIHLGSNLVTSPSGESLYVGSKPRTVTLGFAARSTDEPRMPVSPSSGGATFSGEGNQFWEEQVQRGAAAPQRSTAPVAVPRATPAPTAPNSGTHPAPVSRPIRGSQPRRTLSFLVDEPRGGSSARIFPPRRRHPPFFFGGFGFFGFGFPLAFGFGPDCNPFWAEPFAFGCDAFGYWDGYGGGYNASVYEAEPPEGAEELSQEPAPYTYLPPPESSPEEIEAEKTLVVLYMKNGAVYAVTDYWVADGKLRYLTSYGGENTIEMDDLDLQKTVDVNAKRGVDFILKPLPDKSQPNAPHPPEPNQPQEQE